MICLMKMSKIVNKCKKYLNDKNQVIKYRFNHLLDITGLRDKYIKYLSWSLDTIVTGCVIWYIVNYYGNPISYGLLIVIIVYYVKRFITLIKTPYEDLIREE